MRSTRFIRVPEAEFGHLKTNVVSSPRNLAAKKMYWLPLSLFQVVMTAHQQQHKHPLQPDTVTLTAKLDKIQLAATIQRAMTNIGRLVYGLTMPKVN